MILCDVWDPRNFHYRWYLSDIISRIDNDMIKKKAIMTLFSAMCLFVACLIYVICVCLRIVVPNTYCVVFFVLFYFVLCTPYCQFLWIVHFWLPLRYSLTFMQNSLVSFSLSRNRHFHWMIHRSLACDP